MDKEKRKPMAQAQGTGDSQEGEAQNSNVSFHHHLPQLQNQVQFIEFIELQHQLQTSPFHNKIVPVSLDSSHLGYNSSMLRQYIRTYGHKENPIPVQYPSAPPNHIIHQPDSPDEGSSCSVTRHKMLQDSNKI